MKIGIISDIHGNKFAMNAVALSAKKEGISKLLVLGDIVGYYYHPEEILRTLKDFDCEYIKGNHEEILENIANGKIDAKENEIKYGQGHNKALEKLDAESLNWLYNLPIQKSITIENVSFQLNHGSPASINEYLYPDSSLDKMDECNSETHDFVLIGHSHYPFIHCCKNSVLINCGSVGQSRLKGGLANWAIVDTSNKNVQLRSTPYESNKLIDELRLTENEESYSIKILQR